MAWPSRGAGEVPFHLVFAHITLITVTTLPAPMSIQDHSAVIGARLITEARLAPDSSSTLCLVRCADKASYWCSYISDLPTAPGTDPIKDQQDAFEQAGKAVLQGYCAHRARETTDQDSYYAEVLAGLDGLQIASTLPPTLGTGLTQQQAHAKMGFAVGNQNGHCSAKGCSITASNWWENKGGEWQPENWYMVYEDPDGDETVWKGDEQKIEMIRRNDDGGVSICVAANSLPNPTIDGDTVIYREPGGQAELSVKLFPGQAAGGTRAQLDALQRGEEVSIAQYTLLLPHHNAGWSAPHTASSADFSVRMQVPLCMRSLIPQECWEANGEESTVLTLSLPDQPLFNPLAGERV